MSHYRLCQRRLLVLQFDGGGILWVLRPWQPNLTNVELQKRCLACRKSGNMILMRVCRDDEGKLAAGLDPDVIHGGLNRSDIAPCVNAAINDNMCPAFLLRHRHEETVSKAHPVHAYPDGALPGLRRCVPGRLSGASSRSSCPAAGRHIRRTLYAPPGS